MKILKPASAHSAYDRASAAFKKIYFEITGTELEITTKDDGDDLIVIGSDAVNPVSARLHISGQCSFRCASGSDEYHILSVKDRGRNLLILAGGRGRSTIYAVYRYFELYCGCRYFWDGDIIPRKASVFMDGIDLSESPRFQYRGIRYFAHRSLHRFQAEHWSYEDWQREIDWLLKKRLNMFMLRIGNDDLFQKAFPDTVDYPADDEPYENGDADGYNDRTSAWPLKYRGELRKKVLEYGFSCDLMHPEDCGTMTHWYTRTPVQFLEKVQPKLLKQASEDYKEQTGLVWDITDDKNFDNYFHLTQTHIKEYGKPELFHTIGLAERTYSDDREANMRLKTYVYHRVAERIASEYPNAPLMIASWDLMLKYTPDEVARLLKSFDPNRTILLDYTSDSVRRSNFTNWDTIGKFPWIFGIFHAFEQDSDIHGFYPLIEDRMKEAASDPMCRGFILWPELSHSDTFMTEYLAANAWSPLSMSMDKRIEQYCLDRYAHEAKDMNVIWSKFWPLVLLTSWNVEEKGLGHKDALTDILFYMKFAPHSPYVSSYVQNCRRYANTASDVLRLLAKKTDTESELTQRDIIDIARTILKRYIQFCHRAIEELYLDGKNTENLCDAASELTEILADILEQYSEYSLYHSYDELKAVHEVNPAFEKTLLKNASCQYCRTQIYELIRYLFIPEQSMCFEMLHKAETQGVHPNELRSEYLDRAERNAQSFINARLCDLKPVPADARSEFVSRRLCDAADIVEQLGE